MRIPCSQRILLLTTLLAAAGPAAPSPAEARQRTAVLPVEGVNLPREAARRHARQLERALQRVGLEPVAAELPDPAELPASRGESARGGEDVASAPCVERPACLRRLGQRHRARTVLQLRVGQLGDTVVLRLAAYDPAEGVRRGAWQEVLRQAAPEAVSRALDRLVVNLAPPPRRASPWYTRWWVWTAAGAVVAGSITAAVLATRPSEPTPDLVIKMP